MAAKIDAYLDCVSPYSYFAFLYLLRNRELLRKHGVEVEFIPVFLGGINAATGNKPPSTLPARAKYSPYEMKRAKAAFGAPNVKVPPFFPILSLLPQRAIIFVKQTYSTEKFLAAFKELWIAMWEETRDVSKPGELQIALGRHFEKSEVEKIIEGASDPKVKQQLNENTKTVLEKGAFGCPWLWVRNKEGREEPFFGSDRFHYVWDFLGISREEVVPVERSKL